MMEGYLDVLTALKRRNINASFAADKEAAAAVVLDMIPDNCSVGIGGSITVETLQLEDALREKGCTVFWHWRAKGPDAVDNTRRYAMSADVYLCSTNALTEDGRLINIDGTGNRVAAMIFGPRQVIIIAGKNKIVKNVEDGLDRIKKSACPPNARRLGKRTPCASAECNDCNSPDRMCNVTSIIEGKPSGVEMFVLLVGEALGY
jgi:hypothetical protein